MEYQYITDSSGNRIAIIIPIAKWNVITTKYPDLKKSVNKRKPSDYAGPMSNEEANELRKYIKESRNY